MWYRRWMMVGIGVVALALVLATNPPMVLGQQVVKVAVGVPLTGPLANQGRGVANAIQLAVQEWNQKGGVLGSRIEVLEVDDQANPQVAVAAAEKVVADPDVLGVLYGITSSTCIPVSEIFERANLAMVSPGCGNPVFTERGLKVVTRLISRDDVQGPAGAVFVVEHLKAKKIAFIDDGTAGPRMNSDLAEQRAKTLGATTLRYVVRPGDKDFRPLLGTIPKDINALYISLWAPEAALIAKQRQDVGLNVPMAGIEAMMDEVDYIQASAGAAEGNYVTYWAPDIRNAPEAAHFLQTYQAKYGPLASYDPFAYDAANVLLTAITKVGRRDRAAIVTAVRATSGLKSVYGLPIAFDEKGDLTSRTMYVYQVQGAHFVDLHIPITVPK